MAAKRILIVDDSDAVRTTLRLTLEFKGYDVSEAADGQEGLDLIRANAYDLVFCDLAMPGMDGHELIRQVRQEMKIDDLPIVLLSAEDRQAKARALEAGASGCIAKPFSPQEVLALVETELG